MSDVPVTFSSDAAEENAKKVGFQVKKEQVKNEPTPAPADEFEPHCWICLNPFTTIKCSNCLRTYHDQCMAENCKTVPFKKSGTITCQDVRLKRNVTFKIGVCPECVLISRSDLWDQGELSTVLSGLCRKLHSLFPYYRSLEEMTNVVYPIDLNKLMAKADNMEYYNIEGFYADVKWLLHNIAVYSEGEFEGKTYNEILEGAKVLLKSCGNNINDIKVCHQCFPTWTDFKHACKSPHVLVWVTGGSSHPTWPAKAYQITIKNKKQHLVVVKYFGDKETSKVDISRCYLYNEKSRVETKVKEAVEECDEHKASLEAAFGRVVLPAKDEKEKLLLDLSQNIRKMFPDNFALTTLKTDFAEQGPSKMQ